MANIGLRVLAGAVTVVALALPVVFFSKGETGLVRAQHHPQLAPPNLRPSELQHLPAVPVVRSGVPVLTYHGIAEGGPAERYTVTPYEFHSQIAALSRAGFQTISASEFAAFVQGRPVKLPPRPVLLTFDDGAKTVWTRGDPILRRYGFRATVFLITARVGTHQPFYLTWQEVKQMRFSGRWDFGSHTRDGHRKVRISRGGRFGPFMTNLIWLPDRNRLETFGEYRGRVTADLDGSIAEMRAHGLPRPLLFADPFSGTTGVSNHPAILPTLLRMELARFSGLVNDIEPPRLATRGSARGYVQRIEVFKGTSGRGLLGALLEAMGRRPPPR